MVATLAQIRAGLAANIEAAIADWQVSAYMLSNPTPPVIMVGGPDEVGYDSVFGGGGDWTMPVTAYAGMANDIAAQKRLDVLIDAASATSVKAAIEAARTLGGTVNDVRVLSCSGYRQYIIQPGNILYLGAEWTVQVFN